MDEDKEAKLRRSREASRRFRKRQREEQQTLESKLDELKREQAANSARLSYLQAEQVLMIAVLQHLRTQVADRVSQNRTPPPVEEVA
mmetsp:Transcript_715/g.1040  ORF Transcript_715/g.1040 Transcript_715/m.1040 type:complete len:87 (-) Transcript_715:251-511(-)